MSFSDNQLLAVFGLAGTLFISLYMLYPGLTSLGSAPRGPVIPGLRNWANWCFCNSVLQSLASIPSFRLWLDDRLATTMDAEKSGEPMILTDTLRGMIRILNKEGPAKVYSSSPIIGALETVQGASISRAQQDAQEFLHMLLESVAAEQNNQAPSMSIQQMQEAAKSQGQTYHKLPFEGQLTTTSTCSQCSRQLRSFISPFLELTLLPPDRSKISLRELISNTFTTEHIDDYNCVYCQINLLREQGKDTTAFEEMLNKNPDYDLPASLAKSHVTLLRSTSTSTLPKVLLLHINRSVFTQAAYATRNSIILEYEENLILNGHTYQLRSLVTHKGSHDRGHYISFRRRLKRWHTVSDETVRIVDLPTVLSMGGSAFLLFYEMQDQTRPRKPSRSSRHEDEKEDKLDQISAKM